ncbi:hypothetical protein RhiirA5_424265, partial [Rhizophagus irregularis]
IGVEKFKKALEDDDGEYPNRKGFDIVLMGIQMPVMNGNVATAEIPSEEDKDLAFESGVDGFLTKSVSLKMLEKVLKKWSEKNERSSENSSVGRST